MDGRHLDWTLLRSFLAALDAGSLLGAARRLGCHQPTLSRRIAELESQLGVSLFERTGRGLIPTSAALNIVDEARAMAASAEGLVRRLTAASAAMHGTVRIACSQVLACHVLPRCIARLRLAYPAIQIDVVVSNQLSNLLRRDADIALRLLRPTQASLIAKRIALLPMGAFASPGYVARRGVPRQLKNLLDHELVGLDQDETLLRAMRAAGVPASRASFAVRSDDQVAGIRLVQAGAGIGFMPLPIALHVGGLVRVLTSAALPQMPLWLVVHREIGDSPPIRAVYRQLADDVPAELAAAGTEPAPPVRGAKPRGARIT